jgi:hypothetical protein
MVHEQIEYQVQQQMVHMEREAAKATSETIT